MSVNNGQVVPASIDIIIPVYNVEAYLENFLNSLLAQTNCHWRAICINDGSTDDSLDILNEFSAADNRFLIINQQNQGVSIARNNGIDLAEAKYIMMLDPDDLIEPYMLEEMLNMMESSKAELGACQWNSFNLDGSTGPLKSIYPIDGHYELLELTHRVRFNLTTVLWDKIFKKEIIDEAKLKFSEYVRIGEDSEFIVKYLSHCSHVARLNRICYHYRLGSGITAENASLTFSSDDVLACVNAVRRMMDIECSNKLSRKQKKGFYTILLSVFLDSRKKIIEKFPNRINSDGGIFFGYPYFFVLKTFYKSNKIYALRTLVKHLIN